MNHMMENKKIKEINIQLLNCRYFLNSYYGITKKSENEDAYNLYCKLKQEKKLLLINLERKNKLNILANKKSED